MEQLEREYLRSDLIPLEIGPYHPALPGPIKLKLQLDGELIVHAAVETGFLKRGLEQLLLQSGPWQKAMTLMDHLDPEGAIFGEHLLCLGIEKLAEHSVSERAKAIRLLLSELTRISCHLGFLARFSRSVGSESMFHYALRDRERILDLFELITGARFSFCFLRPGGVCADVTEGFLERVLEVCQYMKLRLQEYEVLFSKNQLLVHRAAYVGVLGRQVIEQKGLSGPNARASSFGYDLRQARPYAGYEKLEFSVPIGMGSAGVVGDVYDRYWVRMREIGQSVHLLAQLSERMPAGEFIIPLPKLKTTEAEVEIETARGILKCFLLIEMDEAGSKNRHKIKKIKFDTPSARAILAVPNLLQGARIEDLSVILSSLDLSLSEVDL